MRNIHFTTCGLTLPQNKYILSSLVFAISVVESYFETNLDQVNLITAKSFEEYIKLVQINRPPAGVTYFNKGSIYTYNPYMWSVRENNHSTTDLKSSLIHELVQLYFSLAKKRPPLWIVKGYGVYLSAYSSTQVRKRERWLSKLLRNCPVPNIFSYKVSFQSHPHPLLCYLIAYKYVEYLSCNYGKFAFIDHHSRHEFGSKSWSSFVKLVSHRYRID